MKRPLPPGLMSEKSAAPGWKGISIPIAWSDSFSDDSHSISKRAQAHVDLAGALQVLHPQPPAIGVQPYGELVQARALAGQGEHHAEAVASEGEPEQRGVLVPPEGEVSETHPLMTSGAEGCEKSSSRTSES